MNSETMSIIRDGNQEWLKIPLPGAEGVSIKVLKADVEMDRAVVKIRFEPGSKMPRHNNFMEDGSIIKIDMPLLKAMEGLTQAAADELDILSLVEIIPAAA